MWLAESQFPEQGLNLGHDCDSPESSPLNHEGTPSKFISRYLWFLAFKKNTHTQKKSRFLKKQ